MLIECGEIDRRYRHHVREKKTFSVFIKFPYSHIFYAEYRYGKIKQQISTGEKNPDKAYNFAVAHLGDFHKLLISRNKKTEKADIKESDGIKGTNTKQKVRRTRRPDIFHKVILSYYVEGSKYLEYDKDHGRRAGENLDHYRTFMRQIAELTPEIKNFEELDRPRLIRLQTDLKNQGVTGKTVNNKLVFLHRVFLYMLDNGLIHCPDPFFRLPAMQSIKTARGMFPVENFQKRLPIDKKAVESGKFKGKEKYLIMGTIGMTTGLRNSEFCRISPDDIIRRKNGYWLHVHGTKTDNAERVQPIPDITAVLIKHFFTKWGIRNPETDYREFSQCTGVLGEYIGYSKEKIKDENITYYGNRHFYDTLLTSLTNINDNVVQYCMGHSNSTGQSNDVKQSYLHLDKADWTKAHKDICGALEYIINPDTGYLKELGISQKEIDEFIIPTADSKIVRTDTVTEKKEISTVKELEAEAKKLDLKIKEQKKIEKDAAQKENKMKREAARESAGFYKIAEQKFEKDSTIADLSHININEEAEKYAVRDADLRDLLKNDGD
jgi:integrase